MMFLGWVVQGVSAALALWALAWLSMNSWDLAAWIKNKLRAKG